jgi:pimeloyl-ACP methyl ester carboxylesterase
VPTPVPSATAIDISDVSWNDSRFITTKDGRKLCYLEAGKPDGIPVIVHTYTNGTRRLFGPWISDAEEKGIRLISFDRPGYEDSTPLPGRAVASAAEDVAGLAEELGLDRLMMWGWSGGGPHVLACAAMLPKLVVAAAVLASEAPFNAAGLDWFNGMGDYAVMEFKAALKGRDTIAQYLKDMTSGDVLIDYYQLVGYWSGLNQADGAALTDKAYAKNILSGIHAGSVKQYGNVDDDIAFTSPWGFELKQIRIPVLVMQGEKDPIVPIAHGKWLAANIPHAEGRFFPDEGHLSLTARHIPEVHDWLLSQWE